MTLANVRENGSETFISLAVSAIEIVEQNY